MGSRQLSRNVAIGVIGGGAAAVCLLDALAEARLEPGEVTVFEPSPHLWRGRPYQPDLDTVRVNIPPEGMSVRFGDQAHFPRWLAARDTVLGMAEPDFVDPINGLRFVPRATYGAYLEVSAHDAVSRLRAAGWRVEIVTAQVTGALPALDGRVSLLYGDGRHLTVDHTVLCVGRGRPGDPYRLSGLDGYLADPYPLSGTLREFGADADVGVVGAGLTGVDVALSLLARGHRGRVLLASRSGVLPRVRQTARPHTLRHFTAERFREAAQRGGTVTLRQVIDLMRAEFAEAGEDFTAVAREITAAPGAEDPVHRLRRHLSEVDDPDRGLRILQQSVPATGPDVWPLLPEADRQLLLRDHYRSMMSLCCPMPATTATALLGMIDSGQLRIVSDVRAIEPAPGGGFALRTGDGAAPLRADRMVNAVSPAPGGLPARAQALVASLVAGGLAEPHPRGGLRTERATSRLQTGGTTHPGLYALGDLAAGSLFFTFGLPSIVDRAYDIVQAIRAGGGPPLPTAENALLNV
ncbi:FAD/NAD(P)-binding protein [Streptomyces sp. NPDC046887]|uniref:FAD/NAD(P)-binding protein n=1 Tax=Streptomyces sp. NPDC046887 TaxID=3155472 RepID=UPI0033BFDD9C